MRLITEDEELLESKVEIFREQSVSVGTIMQMILIK
jgi:predicted HTH domain antitoxin